MNPLHANFVELSERHLCRHSQLWLNVNHLIAVLGTYFALVGIVIFIGSWWFLAGIIGIYLCVLVGNLPLRVLAATAVVLAAIVGLFAVIPPLPVWANPLLIALYYWFQQLGHKTYTDATDLTEFNWKYPKGFALFILLAIYELPILLNYLLFGPKAKEPVNEYQVSAA
jgi:hypothetical protein